MYGLRVRGLCNDTRYSSHVKNSDLLIIIIIIIIIITECGNVLYGVKGVFLSVV